jgi:hypothetical protein
MSKALASTLSTKNKTSQQQQKTITGHCQNKREKESFPLAERDLPVLGHMFICLPLVQSYDPG